MLNATWHEASDVAKQSEMKARINGVAAKMKEFDFLFGLMLAEKLLKHSDNFSRTIQATSMPAIEAHRLSGLCIEVLQRMRTDRDFELFWELSRSTQKLLNVDDPVLKRNRKRPRSYEDGSAEHFFFDTPELFYKQIYFECLDVVVSALKDCFQQRDYSLYASMEQLLMKACSKADYSRELQDVTEFFQNDFNKSELDTHLQLLSCMNIECSGESLTFRDICKHFQCLPNSQALLLSQVSRLVKFVLLMPATNSVSERSASALRRIKTYLRTTMTQSRLNNVMV